MTAVNVEQDGDSSRVHAYVPAFAIATKFYLLLSTQEIVIANTGKDLRDRVLGDSNMAFLLEYQQVGSDHVPKVSSLLSSGDGDDQQLNVLEMIGMAMLLFICIVVIALTTYALSTSQSPGGYYRRARGWARKHIESNDDDVIISTCLPVYQPDMTPLRGVNMRVDSATLPAKNTRDNV